MKKIIAFLFLFIAFKSIAQPTKQGFNQLKLDTTIFKATTVSGDPNYIRIDSNWVKLFSSGSGSIMWGDIAGTLSGQTDLQNALDLKLNINDTTGKWQPLGSYATTAQLNLKVDSTKRIADSVFYYTNGIKHFAYLDSVGTSATPTWAQTLAQGNFSGGNLVTISDGDLITGSTGLWRIDFGTDNQFYVTNANDLTKPHLFIDNSFSELGSSTRFFHSDGASNHNRHDVLIELDAPQVQFNQQVGTGTSIATLSATGLLGRSAFGNMLFADSSNFVRKTDSTNSITGYTTLYQNSLKQNAITTGTTLQYFRGDLSLATFPTNVSSFTNDAGYITSAGVTNIYNTDGTLTGNRILNADGKTLEIQDNGKHQMIFDPLHKYWAWGDYAGDYGNATSIHIADSIGEVRIDGALKLQELKNFDVTHNMEPVYWHEGSQYLSAGFVVDTMWRVAGVDSFYWREQGRGAGGVIHAFKDSVGISSGEVNTASNLGGGLANFSGKSGVDLQFNSFNSSDFDLGSNLISIDYTNGQAADASHKGFVTSTDWNTFNNKQAALTITTVGNNLIGLTNPSAITFIRINADNSVTARSAANFRSDIGAGTGDGTVTSVSGTTNRITSTGGTTPVLDISSTYDALWQPVDADLTTISGLTATTNNFLVSVSSAWASRTPAQVKTTLSLDNVTNESKATMFTSPTFTGTAVIPSPFTLNSTSVTATGTQLNYLNAATGTTGTTSTNLVFSTAPTLTNPVVGTQAFGDNSTKGASTAYMDRMQYNYVLPADTTSGAGNAIVLPLTGSFTVGANETWSFECYMVGQTSSSGGTRFIVAYSGTPSKSFVWYQTNPAALTAQTDAFTLATTPVTSGTMWTGIAADAANRFVCSVINGGSSITVTLKATPVNGAQTTTLHAGCYITGRRTN